MQTYVRVFIIEPLQQNGDCFFGGGPYMAEDHGGPESHAWIRVIHCSDEIWDCDFTLLLKVIHCRFGGVPIVIVYLPYQRCIFVS
jgi:hypothetical protein